MAACVPLAATAAPVSPNLFRPSKLSLLPLLPLHLSGKLKRQKSLFVLFIGHPNPAVSSRFLPALRRYLATLLPRWANLVANAAAPQRFPLSSPRTATRAQNQQLATALKKAEDVYGNLQTEMRGLKGRHKRVRSAEQHARDDDGSGSEVSMSSTERQASSRCKSKHGAGPVPGGVGNSDVERLGVVR